MVNFWSIDELSQGKAQAHKLKVAGSNPAPQPLLSPHGEESSGSSIPGFRERNEYARGT
jgi:hypothetical protein